MSRLTCHLLPTGVLTTVLLLISAFASAEELWIYRPMLGQRFAPGEVVEQSVLVRASVNPILGMSFGVSVDPAFGSVLAVEPSAQLLAAGGGAPLEFLAIEILPEGFTAQATICSACAGWSPGAFPVPCFDFDIEVDAGFGIGSTELCFSGSLGTPPVPVAVVNTVDTVTPVALCGMVYITEHEEWEFVVNDLTVPYARSSGSTTFVATLTIGEYAFEFPLTTQCPGFAFGLAHSPMLLQAISAVPAPPIQAINDGSGPDFFGVDIFPAGITVGCVASLTGVDEFEFPGATETARVSYQTVPSPLAGATSPTTTSLAWTSSLGSPPTAVIILAGDGASVPQGQIDGTVTLVPIDSGEYIRGDANSSGTLDVADAIHVLDYLFGGGALASCPEAADVQDDGAIDVADPIYLLQHLFDGGPPPPAPFPDCGIAGFEPCPLASACP